MWREGALQGHASELPRKILSIELALCMPRFTMLTFRQVPQVECAAEVPRGMPSAPSEASFGPGSSPCLVTDLPLSFESSFRPLSASTSLCNRRSPGGARRGRGCRQALFRDSDPHLPSSKPPPSAAAAGRRHPHYAPQVALTRRPAGRASFTSFIRLLLTPRAPATTAALLRPGGGASSAFSQKELPSPCSSSRPVPVGLS